YYWAISFCAAPELHRSDPGNDIAPAPSHCLDYRARDFTGLCHCFVHAHPGGRGRTHGQSGVPRGNGPESTIPARTVLKRIVPMRSRILSALTLLWLTTALTDPQRMKGFDEAVRKARRLAAERLEKTPYDPEALYALTLCAGMESDSDMILRKHNLDALKRLKEGNAHAKALLAERPDAYDAY